MRNFIKGVFIMKIIMIGLVIALVFGIFGVISNGVDEALNSKKDAKYEYSWELEVSYTDGTYEDMTFDFKSYSDEKCTIVLTEGGSLKAVEGMGLFNSIVIVNGVKRFKIIDESKEMKGADYGY